MYEKVSAPFVLNSKGDLLTRDAAGLARRAVGPDGSVLTADSSQVTGLSWQGQWQAFATVWTASGTTPALNDGTLTFRYVQIGKTMICRLRLVFGASTTSGTGYWKFSLPVAALDIGQAGALYAENNGVLAYPGTVRFEDTGHIILYGVDGSQLIGQNVPFAWGVLDFINAQFTYEAA